ncbi:unnamed protein product, partial [Closterium sp. NIES-54]
LLRSGVDIFALDYDAILSAMYALSVSAEGDCYLCVPPDPRIEAAALGASESALPGTTHAEALHTFILDSGASRYFFRDSTSLTPLPAPIPVRLANPSRGPVLARSSTVLPCPAVPSGSLFGLHLPSFSTNLVRTAALQDAMVTTTTPRGPVAAPCSCRLLSNQTLVWHNRLGHPSLPRLRGMHSHLLVSGLPRSLPPLPPSPAPPCLPCIKGRQRAAPHSSSFSPTTAPLQTLHMDVWGPARVSGQGHEHYFLLVVDEYTRYTTVFPLCSKGEVPDVLIPWIRAVRLQLRERFHEDLPVLRLHSDRGGEFSSDLLWDFCRGEGILQTFTLPASSQQNRVAKRHIGLLMEVARTSMIHAAAPHFLWPFAVRYAAHQLNLWPRVSLPETSPTLRWTGKVGDVSVFRMSLELSVSGPLTGTVPVEVAVDSGAARGAVSGGVAFGGTASWGVASRGAEPASVEPGGTEPEGAERGGAESEGAESGGAEHRDTASAGGSGGASSRLSPRREPLSPQQLREWFAQRTRLRSGAAGAGGSPAGGSGAGGAGATSPGAAGASGVGDSGAGDLGAGGTGAGGAGAGGAGARDPGAGGTGAGGAGAGGTVAGGDGVTARARGTEGTGGASPGGARTRGTRAAGPTVPHLQASIVTDPSFESIAASALVAELVDFAASCLLDYATSLVARSDSDCPPSVRDIPTSRSYAEAFTGPYSSQWQTAMDAEMAPWKYNGTYVDAVPPSGANIVDDMWIFRVKRPPGSPPVFKARYVARGFRQRQGVDNFHNFSPTPKMTTLRVLFHIAAQRDYELHSLDFNTAFLQGSLHKEIWLRRPPSFAGSFPAGTQWSLLRPIYGLRQAPCEWHNTLRTTLAALGFAPSTSDPSMFLCTDTSLLPFYILVYVDDLVFATADTKALALVKAELQKIHTCSDLGPLVLRLPVLLATVHSCAYQSLAPSSTFGRVRRAEWPVSRACGCLMYLMTCTRPDLAYPLSILACYVALGRYRPEYWEAAKRVLRYLCSTSGMGLVLGGRGPVVLTRHTDASWVDDLATQRSSQGYTFSLGSGFVSWRSNRSSSFLSSCCEAEIYAGAMAAQELRWLTYLLPDFGERPRSSPVLYVDNKAMIALCQEHRLEYRTKQIALRYFLARESQQRGQLHLAYMATRANIADIFTKALQSSDDQRFCTILGLVPTCQTYMLHIV